MVLFLEKKHRDSLQEKQQTRTLSQSPSIALKAEGTGRATTTRTQLSSKKKSFRVGDICNLKITALAANNIGIDEYSFPYAVFVPNAKIGSQIKAKILKIKESSYAVAQLLEEKSINSKVTDEKPKSDVPVKPGDVLTVSIKKQMENGKAGIVEFPNNFRLIIPFANLGTNLAGSSTNLIENVKVTVTRVKLNYGFAKIGDETSAFIAKQGALCSVSKEEGIKNVGGVAPSFTTGKQTQKSGFNIAQEGKLWNSKMNLEVGSKFTTTLPASSLKSFTKGNGKFVVLTVNNSVLFLKMKKGGAYFQKLVMNGELRVRIKITSKSTNCLVGKILQLNPVSKTKKTALVLNSIREMISHGMHFGEKAVKCNARMKNYIWSVRSRSTTSGGDKTALLLSPPGKEKGIKGVASLLPPKGAVKRPLIKKGRHVINLLKTRRCLNQALKKVTKYALKGRTFLFIGTKKPAAGLVARASFFTKNSFYVNTRWLGGMLTNWKTICKSISKIRPILKEKQKVVRDILERRQAIKKRLIKKAVLLRKKSKLILSKGRLLLETLKNNKLSRVNNAKKLTVLRDEFINKGMQYLEKRQRLIQKRRELIYQTILLKEKGLDLSLKHKAVLNQLAIYAKKLREYKYLLILTSEIKNIKEVTSTSTNNLNLLSVSYGKLKEINLLLKKGSSSSSSSYTTETDGDKVVVKDDQQNLDWILPNPPKEFLNRIVVCASKAMKNQNNNNDFTTSSLISGKSSPTHGEDSLKKGVASPHHQFIVCSTLLSKFSNFSSYIKSVIKSLITSIQSLETQAKTYSTQLNQIQTTLQTYLNFKNKYVHELQQLKLKFIKERSMIRIVKRKLKALEAQKKLLKFLPRLRYLPTPQTKISEIVQILLARIVDPKLKYPIENIYDQKLSTSSKKLAAARKKKWQRLEKYFGGIANMTKLTKTQISRNVAIIIGQKEEMNAVRECQKLGIKMFTIVDTNCNPTFSDHIIPANDDSRSSIKYILTKFITRIRLAQKLRSRLAVYMAK
uniref:Small ribosomal subunit protein uS2c n=1 Tax=Chloromonas perforata TaxID=51730 RepID=A0A0S2LNT3_9CHLO|nr:ribosomal protein S2 [Chloromonas perforata]